MNDLAELRDIFFQEIDLIRASFAEGSPHRIPGCSPIGYSVVGDGALVSLWDAWSRFLRSLLLTCANDETLSLSGNTYSPNEKRDERAALNHLVEMAGTGRFSYTLAFRGRGEPKWHLTRGFNDICIALGLENSEQISDAVGCSSVYISREISYPNPCQEIHKIRNYCSHKSIENLDRTPRAREIREAGGIDLYLRNPTLGGGTKFDDWCLSLKAIAEQSMQ